MKENTCCFTGHRDIPAEKGENVKTKLKEQILVLLEEGISTFLVGGALGFDMLAAEVLVDLREREGKKFRLVSVLPFPDWREGWPAEEYAREEAILKNCDEFSLSGEKCDRKLYLDRDRKMVDASSVCVAWCSRRSGGTAYTVRYALKQGVQVVNLADWDVEVLRK